MSRLYLTESGNVVPTLCEELSTNRRARKLLRLPTTASPATIYLLARPHRESRLPLRLAINGTELQPLPPKASAYLWYDVRLPPSLLRGGENRFEFWTEGTALNTWSLAIESGHVDPASFRSDDGGRTWRNQRMSYLNVLRGEYVIRARLEEGDDPPPPSMVWEDPRHPRSARLRELMPAAVREPGSMVACIRALTAWTSTRWEHTSSLRAAQYAPWDPETILAWGENRCGHDGRVPIVMCVHYAVLFVGCCQAVGIPARCAVLMGAPDGFDGHFVAEVWLDGCQKWVVVDPNLDTGFRRGEALLSLREIQQMGTHLRDAIDWGPGAEFQRRNPALVEWIRDVYEPGVCFQRRAIWPRADFLSHPELTPPGHGSTAYCETMLVWETRDREHGLGMFPYFADAAYFDAPPIISANQEGKGTTDERR